MLRVVQTLNGAVRPPVPCDTYRRRSAVSFTVEPEEASERSCSTAWRDI